MVKTLGDQFLARPPLADDEHGPIERRGTARPLDRVEEGEALADELFSALHVSQLQNLTDCWWQIPPFGKDFRVVFRSENRDFSRNLAVSTKYGTSLVWIEAGLGP